MPEKALVTAIIGQAVSDLFTPDYLVTPAERDQALALLTDRHGEWAEDGTSPPGGEFSLG